MTCLFCLLLKNCCSFWSPKIVKVDFEAIICAIYKVFPDSVSIECNFHFNRCLWRQIQNIGLAVEHKTIEQVRLMCRMCAALAHLLVNKGERWLMIITVFQEMRN
jgi:hypothetical protein